MDADGRQLAVSRHGGIEVDAVLLHDFLQVFLCESHRLGFVEIRMHQGDELVLLLGKHKVTARVLTVREFARKDEAKEMYEILKDEIINRGGEDNGQP
jgi:hypothetical protein